MNALSLQHAIASLPRALLAALFFTGMTGFDRLLAQEPGAPPAAPEVKEVSPGIFAIGRIVLDQNARSVRFPGELNMKDGTLEYLLVTERGSTHESLLSSTVQPKDLHFAMLLL